MLYIPLDALWHVGEYFSIATSDPSIHSYISPVKAHSSFFVHTPSLYKITQKVEDKSAYRTNCEPAGGGPQYSPVLLDK